MTTLIEALFSALIPYLVQPFAFFGHSMGAVVAFELARHLRRHRQPMPTALLVSGARAPQYRLGHVAPPEPSEEQFLDELRRMQGIPPDWLANEELLRVILPALRADSRMYRNYVYTPEAPLDCSIRAYGGAQDPRISREQLDNWKAQTTASFCTRFFVGGHFFIQTAQPQFLQTLSRDVGELVV